jgi:hypothetical protein
VANEAILRTIIRVVKVFIVFLLSKKLFLSGQSIDVPPTCINTTQVKMAYKKPKLR